MDKPGGLVGELIEKGQNTSSNVVSDISDTVIEQIGVTKPKGTNQQASPSSDQAAQAQVNPSGEAKVSEATKEIVGDFYAPTSDDSSSSSNPASQGQSTEQKLASVRQELLKQHKSEYYDPLFAYENKKAEPSKAEVIEQEENQKMQELALDQQKKDQDIAVQNAKTAVEAHRGVAG